MSKKCTFRGDRQTFSSAAEKKNARRDIFSPSGDPALTRFSTRRIMNTDWLARNKCVAVKSDPIQLLRREIIRSQSNCRIQSSNDPRGIFRLVEDRL